MTVLVIAVLCLGTLGYVLWPVFGQAAGRDEPLPLEQLEPPPGER